MRSASVRSQSWAPQAAVRTRVATGLADQARVVAVGVAAGVGPWRQIGPVDPDDPELAILALADARDVPAALREYHAFAAQAFDQMMTLDDDEMVAEFFAGAPEGDLAWLDATARRRWAADLRDALQTYDGYALDNIAWGSTWDIDPRALRVPTWLWYGQLDRMVPPSHGDWLAERIPGSTLVRRPGKGHGGTVFEFWEDMLGAIAAPPRHASR